MKGINRAHQIKSEYKRRINTTKKCIFISHQKDDLEDCIKIAECIMKAGIDVYLDDYDPELKHYLQINNPDGVVDCIKKGIDNSTHMLCVISNSTLDSKWVPWEIGYGHGKIKLGVLTLKGIAEYELPEYIRTVPILRGIDFLIKYLAEINRGG